MREPEAITLSGQRVRLEPLRAEHAQGLYLQGQYAPDWAWLPRSCFLDVADVRQWIDEALAAPSQVPFVMLDQRKGRTLGSTRYLNISVEHRRLEIGWTWLGREWQGTGVNAEAKYLLLEHAFEKLGCRRVEFKTDARNQRSLRALEKLGAVREGVLRKHMVAQGGEPRDSVYFSVVDDEWPGLKARLSAGPGMAD